MSFCSISERLQRAHDSRAESIWLKFKEQSYTCEQFVDAVRDNAAKLTKLNVQKGDVVPTFFGNSGPGVEAWFGCAHIGAIWTPLNLEFRGQQLVRSLNVMGADLVFADHEYLNLLVEIEDEVPSVRTVLVRNWDGQNPFSRIQIADFDTMRVEYVPQAVTLEPMDPAMIQFTSGSTGLSKGVELSHGYLTGQAQVFVREYGIRNNDILYCPFPLYHWDATVGTVLAALYADAVAALAKRFSVSGFWDDIRDFEATVFDFMGATLTFIFERPEAINDADNPVRMAWGVPMPAFKAVFESRFGLALREGYGSTEGGVTVYQREGETYPNGSCGRIAPEYELRIADDLDVEVPVGEVGEIQTRPREDSSMMMTGYFGMPEVTEELMRGGWYRTGDLGWVDENGNLFFAGRKKDVIRRRGENISALEIEKVLETHPDISVAAAYGVPSQYTEEEVAVSIIAKEGRTVSEDTLRQFCEGRMARYMVPLFFRFVDKMPQTGTGKISKPKLKSEHAQEIELENAS